MAQQTFNNTKINVEFDEATSRQQLNNGDNISTLFGKIKKIFTDLKSIAFSGSYNDLSDNPTSLPANGGNADTVGGLSPNIIAHGYSNSYSDANLCLKSGFYYMSSDSMSTPVYADGILVVSNIASSDSDENSISQVFFNTDGLSIASRMMIGGTFTDWKEISFAPIKSTAINGTTDTSGNIRFSAISNGMMPIFTAINNLFCTPFVSGTNYYIHIENKSGAVASTAVSGTIYYAQL